MQKDEDHYSEGGQDAYAEGEDEEEEEELQSSSKKPPVAKPNSVVSSSANKVSYVLCDLLNKLTCHPQEGAGAKNSKQMISPKVITVITTAKTSGVTKGAAVSSTGPKTPSSAYKTPSKVCV